MAIQVSGVCAQHEGPKPQKKLSLEGTLSAFLRYGARPYLGTCVPGGPVRRLTVLESVPFWALQSCVGSGGSRYLVAVTHRLLWCYEGDRARKQTAGPRSVNAASFNIFLSQNPAPMHIPS